MTINGSFAGKPLDVTYHILNFSGNSAQHRSVCKLFKEGIDKNSEKNWNILLEKKGFQIAGIFRKIIGTINFAAFIQVIEARHKNELPIYKMSRLKSMFRLRDVAATNLVAYTPEELSKLAYRQKWQQLSPEKKQKITMAFGNLTGFVQEKVRNGIILEEIKRLGVVPAMMLGDIHFQDLERLERHLRAQNISSKDFD